MANYVVSDTNLTLIADAIRAKSGHNELLEWPNEYKTAIDNLNPVDMCIKTVTDDVVSVSDAAQYDAKNASIKIEPVQDLHGYDHPWPAGGGENLLDPNIKFPTGTQYGLTFTSADGYTFSYTGTATSSGNILSSAVNQADAIILPAGTYISKNGILQLYKADGGWLRNQYSGYVFTCDEPFCVRSIYWQIVEGQTYNINSFIALVKGSTAPTSWTPYSNICPISGWTGANVTKCGVNLYDSVNKPFVRYSQYNPSVCWTSPIFFKAGRYTFKSTAGFGNCYLNIYATYADAAANTNRTAQYTFVNGTEYSLKFVSDVYIRLQQNNVGSGTTEEYAIVTNSWQVNIGSTATDYEPYQGEIIPVSWESEAGTVYGGTLDVVNGVLTVDRVEVDLGTLSWAAHQTYGFYSGGAKTTIKSPTGNAYPVNSICSNYKVVAQVNEMATNCSIACDTAGILYVHDDAYSDVTTFKAAMSGVQLVYELATPITYQLTPQHVALLRGNNNVWADTGDTTLTYYTEDFADLADEIGFAEGGDY